MPPATEEEAENPRSNKRRCVQSACVPCRKRKSKCDGESPLCATCNLHKTACFYYVESESRRRTTTTATTTSSTSTPATSTSSRKRSEPKGQEQEKGSDAGFIMNALRSLPESEAHDLLQQIRQDPHKELDVAKLAETWQKTVQRLSSTPPEPPTLETDLAVLLGKPSVTQTGESRHFGHTSSLGLVDEDENYTQSQVRPSTVKRTPSNWTTLTQDVAFIERLFGLYFQWSHGLYILFSRDHFLADFYSGREKYCSPLLVNAILAYACHFSDEPQARTDPSNSRTAGDRFFAEARRLLFEDGSPSVPTTQALCVMALREPSAGRDSSGFMYVGQCIRMAVELGLHLDSSASPALGLTQDDILVRKVTFWGAFTLDSVWSICVGRISQLPKAAITIGRPTASASVKQAHDDHLFLEQFSILSEIINDNNYMFFAPKERFTSRRLLDCYHKYQDWYQRLPSQLHPQHDSRPQARILMLHMLYHTLLVHLFRPMLKVDLIRSDLRPRDACIEAANKVSELLRLYREHYDLRACYLILAHYLLSINVVHLLYSTDNQLSAMNLVEGLQALEDMSACHYFAVRTFKIMYSLSSTWNLPWPNRFSQSKLLSQGDGSSLSPPENLHVQPVMSSSAYAINHGYNPLHRSQHTQRQSPNMFVPRQSSLTAQVQPSPTPIPSHAQHNPSYANSTHPQYSASSASAVLSTNIPPGQGPTNTLFFNVPGIGAPITRNFAVGPMALDNMLEYDDEWERFGRDGFARAAAVISGNCNGNGNDNGNGIGYGSFSQVCWDETAQNGAGVG